MLYSAAHLCVICVKLPTNENDFLRISGVGIKKQEKYVKEFIQIIKNIRKKVLKYGIPFL